jgi:hypothetical protein
VTVTGVTRFSSEILLLTWTIDAEDTINSMKRLACRPEHIPSPVAVFGRQVFYFGEKNEGMEDWLD